LPHAAIAVFTGKKLGDLLAQGGSGPWVGAEERVKQQQYLICVRKAKPGTDDHGAAFLVGKIAGVQKHGFDRRGQQRWFFQISDFATLMQPGNGSGVIPSDIPPSKTSELSWKAQI
jgi:hypothetical protein